VIAAVFIAALSVAFTFLATVHWLPLRGEEPAMVAGRGLSARLPAELASEDPRVPETAERRTAPRVPVWAHTQPLDYEEAA